MISGNKKEEKTRKVELRETVSPRYLAQMHQQSSDRILT